MPSITIKFDYVTTQMLFYFALFSVLYTGIWRVVVLVSIIVYLYVFFK